MKMALDCTLFLALLSLVGCELTPDRIELCDNKDNNGDGMIDEGFAIGTACSDEGRSGKIVLRNAVYCTLRRHRFFYHRWWPMAGRVAGE